MTDGDCWAGTCACSRDDSLVLDEMKGFSHRHRGLAARLRGPGTRS
ncbi:hypothetical protein HMPREF0682_1425 [Propionibacterium acidifaciens F0233]|uniref:Uncharacterized protein n=1 Tax=Propionibacterium acidifaciens F0233 TaxID=553198 RepID=U2Q220_9ACTN|nr:hypothetical protein HMPREF0682_1425 [Propionibacterium acidifaciens F0233]